MDDFDILIIGAGQAGGPLASALADGKRRVALVERRHLGGSCVNFGCTPTKAALASARLAHLARRGADFGLVIPEVKADFAAVLGRAQRLAIRSRNSLATLFMRAHAPELLHGHARFVGRDGERFRIRIGEQEVTARHVVLDTGTRSRIPDVPGLAELDFLHAGNWLDHTELPRRLAVLGGGYIGIEMAQFYRRMGAEVTVLDGNEQVLQHEDADVATALRQLLEGEGVDFMLRSRLARVERHGDELRLTLQQDGRERRLSVSQLFVATGRRPNTDDLGLDTIGLAPDDKGLLKVDERLATEVDGVWAVGDIRGGPMFTHTAWDDYRIVESQLIGDGTRTTDRVVPYAVFTDPELGRVGMTEREARASGKRIEVAHFDMQQNGKARELGETAGFIKVVVDAATRRLLGAAVLAVEGAELVHSYVELMNADVPYTVLEDAIHIHPTLAEAVQSAVAEIELPRDHEDLATRGKHGGHGARGRR